MVTRGLSERRALRVVHMSATALRYVPRPDPDPSLGDRIVALAHRHRRYGAGMIYLEAAPGRPAGQSQTGRPTLRGGAPAGQAPASQEGAPGGPSAPRAATGPQRSVVGGLRVRSHGRRARLEGLT